MKLEEWSWEQEVGGSNPPIPTNYFSHFVCFSLRCPGGIDAEKTSTDYCEPAIKIQHLHVGSG